LGYWQCMVVAEAISARIREGDTCNEAGEL
jgi:hypothetical protein